MNSYSKLLASLILACCMGKASALNLSHLGDNVYCMSFYSFAISESPDTDNIMELQKALDYHTNFALEASVILGLSMQADANKENNATISRLVNLANEELIAEIRAKDWSSFINDNQELCSTIREGAPKISNIDLNAKDIFIHPYIEAVPMNSVDKVVFFFKKYTTLFLAWVYFFVLATINWGIILPLVTYGGLPKKVFQLGAITFGGYYALQALWPAVNQLKFAISAAQGALAMGMIFFLLGFSILILIIVTPIVVPQQYYNSVVYGGASISTHERIKEAREYWNLTGVYEPNFTIEDTSIRYIAFDDKDEFDQSGAKISMFWWGDINLVIKNQSDLPLVYGEVFCSIQSPTSEVMKFVSYIDPVIEYSTQIQKINNFNPTGFGAAEEDDPQFFFKGIQTKETEFSNQENLYKQYQIFCNPLASFHSPKFFKNKGPVKAIFDRSNQSITLTNNSKTKVSYFSLECINNNGEFTRAEFKIDEYGSRLNPGFSRVYKNDDLEFSPRILQGPSSKNFSDFSLTKALDCGLYSFDDDKPFFLFRPFIWYWNYSHIIFWIGLGLFFLLSRVQRKS